MSTQVKSKRSKIIKWTTVAGLSSVIIGAAAWTTTVLVNSNIPESNCYSILYNDLNQIYNSIINEYGKSSNNSLTIYDLEKKVQDGTFKDWFIDKFSNYFINSSSKSIELDISFENDSIILSLPDRNKFNVLSYINSSNNSFIEYNDNKIIMKFSKFDFSQIIKFSNEQLNQIKEKIITLILENQNYFDELVNVSTVKEQKEVNSFVINLFGGVEKMFSSIQFRKNLNSNDFANYELIVKFDNEFSTQWVEGENDTDEIKVLKNEVQIVFPEVIFIEKKSLLDLSKNVNNFINDNYKINVEEWELHLSNKDDKYNDLKEFFYKQLCTLINKKLDDTISDIVITKSNLYNLNILMNKYKFTSDFKSKYLKSGNIILSDLMFYKYKRYVSANLDELVSKINQIIFSNQFTIDEFYDWFLNNDMKEFVVKNLKLFDGTNIDLDVVDKVTFDKDSKQIKIIPKSEYKFYCISNRNDVKLEQDGTISILLPDFSFFNYIENLDSLYKYFQTLISAENVYRKSFNNYLQNNKSNFLKVTSSLLNLESDEVFDISFLSNTFKIHLKPKRFIKLHNNDSINYFYEDNTLIFKNIKFTNEILVDRTKLDNILSFIQKYINDSYLTKSEFLNLSNKTLKDFLIEKLNILSTDTSSLVVSGNKIIINPKKNMYFVPSWGESLMIDSNGNIVIDVFDLKYYNIIKVDYAKLSLVKLLFNGIFIDVSFTEILSHEKEINSKISTKEIIDSLASALSLSIESIKSIFFSNGELIILPGDYLKFEIDYSNLSYPQNSTTPEGGLTPEAQLFWLSETNPATIRGKEIVFNSFVFSDCFYISQEKINFIKNNLQSIIDRKRMKRYEFYNFLQNWSDLNCPPPMNGIPAIWEIPQYIMEWIKYILGAIVLTIQVLISPHFIFGVSIFFITRFFIFEQGNNGELIIKSNINDKVCPFVSNSSNNINNGKIVLDLKFY